MIDWIYPPEWPDMVEHDNTPLQLGGKPVPAIHKSEPVLLALENPNSKLRRIMVGRVCRADGYDEPFERVYGRRIVAWAHIEWPEAAKEQT